MESAAQIREEGHFTKSIHFPWTNSPAGYDRVQFLFLFFPLARQKTFEGLADLQCESHELQAQFALVP